MSKLDKVVYLADMTSKERDWPGVGKLRKLEMKDLDAAMLAALKQTNDFVLSQASRWTPSPLPPMRTSWPIRRKNADCESWGRMVY
mgnify:FL=1